MHTVAPLADMLGIPVKGAPGGWTFSQVAQRLLPGDRAHVF